MKSIKEKGSTFCFDSDSFEIFLLTQPLSTKKTPSTIKKVSMPLINQKELNPEYIRSSDKKMVGISLVSGCNLACRYCYINAGSKKVKLMTKEKFEKILTFISEEPSCNNLKQLYFMTGGEPTLNYQLIKEIPSICKSKGFVDLHFDVTTNGTTLTPEMLSFFKMNGFTLNISLDGDQTTTNSSRVFSNGKGAFERIMQTVELLSKSGTPFTCKSVFQPSLGGFDKASLFFEDNQIPFIFDFSSPSNDDSYIPQIGDLRHFRNEMRKLIECYARLIPTRKTIYSKRIMSDLLRIHYGSIKQSACSALISGFIIDIDGYIYSCSPNSGSHALSIGTIETGIDYERAFSNGFYAKPFYNQKECRHCWIRNLCSGGCFARNFKANGTATKVDRYYCQQSKIYWEYIIKLYTRVYSLLSEDFIHDET